MSMTHTNQIVETPSQSSLRARRETSKSIAMFVAFLDELTDLNYGDFATAAHYHAVAVNLEGVTDTTEERP